MTTLVYASIVAPNNAHQLILVNAHCTVISESFHNLSHSTPLLTNGNVDAVQLLLCGQWEEARVSAEYVCMKITRNLLSSSASLNRFWLMMVSMAMAVLLHTQEDTN